jgi:hypothetical protein
MENPVLKLSVPTATAAEVDRGLAAAVAVFRQARIHPIDAAAGAFAREGWDMGGFVGDIEDKELKAARVWDDANAAAREAACAGWPASRSVPDIGLEIVVDAEAQLADRATALAMLHKMVETGSRRRREGILAGIVVEDLADQEKARRLVDAVTIAFSSLEMAGYYPEEPVEPKRQAVIDAIDALEAA